VLVLLTLLTLRIIGGWITAGDSTFSFSSLLILVLFLPLLRTGEEMAALSSVTTGLESCRLFLLVGVV
jgi:hypothetical protein